MFIVLLTFSENKPQAGEFMEAHKDWLQDGFSAEIFLAAGNIQPNKGGGILAHNVSLSELRSRINEDPFVVNNVVNAEIIEFTPSKTSEQLQFLLN